MVENCPRSSMGAPTPRPYPPPQRPWELYPPPINPIPSSLGVFFRVDPDRAQVRRVLPTRACRAWVSDYTRLVAKIVPNNYPLRRLYSKGARLHHNPLFGHNLFPIFSYKCSIIKKKLFLEYMGSKIVNINLLNGVNISYNTKIWSNLEKCKNHYGFGFQTFHNFKYMFKFIIKRFVFLSF